MRSGSGVSFIQFFFSWKYFKAEWAHCAQRRMIASRR